MRKKKIVILIVIVVFGLAFYFKGIELFKRLIGYNIPPLEDPGVTETNDPSLSFLTLPSGIKISTLAKDLSNPRVIRFDARGRMLVSETKSGRVSVLEDKNKDGDFETKQVLIENLRSPHGLDFYTDKGILYLYIAETHQVARYPYNLNTGKLTDTKGESIATLPADGRHFTRTILFGPNFRIDPIVSGVSTNTLGATKLYISVGSSCDTCVEEETWKRAAILEADPSGIYTAEFAGGLRNSVFFAFHPVTKEIWATEMGRDNLGDNLPPDEVNIIKVAGPEDKFGAKRYGWPFCYGNKIQDKSFKPAKFERIDIPQDCNETQPPLIQIQAHSAPLGLAFIPSGKGWPKELEGDLLVALHGSWNRSEPVGYKIVRYDLDANGRVLSSNPIDFVSGWLGQGKVYGRPVDLQFSTDGSLYVPDDAAGLIYKVVPQ